MVEYLRWVPSEVSQQAILCMSFASPLAIAPSLVQAGKARRFVINADIVV
jgi:hypothetical protein